VSRDACSNYKKQEKKNVVFVALLDIWGPLNTNYGSKEKEKDDTASIRQVREKKCCLLTITVPGQRESTVW